MIPILSRGERLNSSFSFLLQFLFFSKKVTFPSLLFLLLSSFPVF
jgi:hypothetical protein